MAIRRQSWNVIAALAVYLTAIVGGAFHHHAHRLPSGNAETSLTVIDNAAGTNAEADDEHDCAVCASIHQAKISPPAQTLAPRNTFVQELRITSIASILLVSIKSTQARAPPV